MLGSLAAMAGWQGSDGQKVSVVGSLAVGRLKNFRCLAPLLPWLAGRDAGRKVSVVGSLDVRTKEL